MSWGLSSLEELDDALFGEWALAAPLTYIPPGPYASLAALLSGAEQV